MSTGKNQNKVVEHDLKYTQPRYMNVVGATKSFAPMLIIITLLIRIVIGSKITSNVMPILMIASVIFLLAWFFVIRKVLLSNGTNLKYKPAEKKHYFPLAFISTIAWYGLALIGVAIIDMWAYNATSGNYPLTKIVAHIWLGAVVGREYHMLNFGIITILVGILFGVFSALFAYGYCCHNGTPIADFIKKRNAPKKNPYDLILSDKKSVYVEPSIPVGYNLDFNNNEKKKKPTTSPSPKTPPTSKPKSRKTNLVEIEEVNRKRR